MKIFKQLIGTFVLLLFFNCGGDSFYPPHSPSRTIGGVFAGDADAGWGYEAGGGECGKGGDPKGKFCVAQTNGTTFLQMSGEGKYQVRWSDELNGCVPEKEFNKFGELITEGEYLVIELENEGSYLKFIKNSCPPVSEDTDGTQKTIDCQTEVVFSFTSNYFGLNLCDYQGSSELVGIVSGSYPRML